MTDDMHVYHVHLSEKAKETIEEEIGFTDFESKEGQTGFRETGGWLWSPQGQGWWSEEGVDIIEASGPGPSAEKGYDNLTLQSEYLWDLDAMFRRDGLELCGGFHTHPHGEVPSEEDLTRIGAVLDYRAIWECRTQRALEIIITRKPGDPLGSIYRHGDGWEMWPYVFYRGPGGILGNTAIWPEGAILHLEN